MAEIISKNNESLFEQIKHTDDYGNEYWMARQFAKVLGYTDFRNFTGVIEKAQEACKNSGNNPLDHLVEANEMVAIGSGAIREMSSYKLSRYACYLNCAKCRPFKRNCGDGTKQPLN